MLPGCGMVEWDKSNRLRRIASVALLPGCGIEEWNGSSRLHGIRAPLHTSRTTHALSACLQSNSQSNGPSVIVLLKSNHRQNHDGCTLTHGSTIRLPSCLATEL
eukprot:1155568-Pelagomonas_calceolata.AAC.3